jgi:hypothetical protein
VEGEEEDMPLVFGSNICGTQQKYLGFSEQDLNGLRILSSLDAKKKKSLFLTFIFSFSVFVNLCVDFG